MNVHPTMASGKSKIDLFENAESIIETTTITNLNTDCMEIIFEHLELNELINIADSNKRFYSAACQVYRRKFRNQFPIFSPNECSR